ncbi:exonuclease domain-containing protein [Corynebacterium bouchesdurhonense]|uniref:exonuclease domain-containing protein n=1 Tax=Corynebacterium bouchesdurhonense TaxID=1720192 RepID=UPI00098EFCB2|nr:exonuclease domain-containing protein [Corynebacterium bouchesdurhonense]
MALLDALRYHLDGNTSAVETRLCDLAAEPAPAQPGAAGRRGRAAKYIPSRSKLLQDSFVAVDFETANRVGGASACQVGMVRVEDGDVAESFCTYLRPPEEHIAFEFSHIHGIYRGDVEDAPSWFDIADRVVEFVAGAPVYAHNATFDASVWRGLDRYYFTGTFPTEFYCTARMSRRLLPQLPDHTLPTVAAYCAPGFRLDHHRADSDALACAHIVAQFQRDRALHPLLAP